MAWTILNNTGTSISVNDIPIPQEILPYSTAIFNAQDVQSSHALRENIANGSLCVVSFGTFSVSGGIWLPVTYPIHPSAQEAQSGQSNPVTVGTFSTGKVLLNVTSISSGGSLSIWWQDFDGTVFYPAQSIISNVTTTSLIAEPFSEYGIAGRFTWAVTGTITFSLLLQMR